MTLAWFYADSQRQQQGPVADSWLYNAYQRGEITLNTLVWREGMAQWLPLSQVAAELGITLPNVPPPAMPRAPGPRPPAAAKSGGSGCLIIGIILLVGFVVVGGILAAIAIPAYQDFTVRSRVMNAHLQGTMLKSDVSAFFMAEGRCPTNEDSGFNSAASYASTEIASISIGALDDGRCGVQILLNDLGGSSTQGTVMLFAMDSEIQWTESSTVPKRYLPMSMRD